MLYQAREHRTLILKQMQHTYDCILSNMQNSVKST